MKYKNWKTISKRKKKDIENTKQANKNFLYHFSDLQENLNNIWKMKMMEYSWTSLGKINTYTQKKKKILAKIVR